MTATKALDPATNEDFVRRMAATAGDMACQGIGADRAVLLLSALDATRSKLAEVEQERDAMRALLMLAHDFIPAVSNSSLRASIREAVCPLGEITEADMEWAHASYRAAKGETT